MATGKTTTPAAAPRMASEGRLHGNAGHPEPALSALQRAELAYWYGIKDYVRPQLSASLVRAFALNAEGAP